MCIYIWLNVCRDGVPYHSRRRRAPIASQQKRRQDRFYSQGNNQFISIFSYMHDVQKLIISLFLLCSLEWRSFHDPTAGATQ